MKDVSGYYIRINNHNSADIKIVPLHNGPRDHYRIIGTALAGGSREVGPNTGTIDFIAHLEQRRHFRFAEPPYEIRLDFVDQAGQLWVGETNPEVRHGAGVSFGGVYRRA